MQNHQQQQLDLQKLLTIGPLATKTVKTVVCVDAKVVLLTQK